MKERGTIRVGKSNIWRPLGAYSLLFAIICLCVFSLHLAMDKTLIWEGDGVKQHVRALIFMGQWLRDIATSCIHGAPQFSTYSYALGYGGDVLTTLSYYALGDPLNLLSAFVPARYTYILFNALCIVRLWLTGISFYLYTRYRCMGNAQARLAGSLLYAFSMFALCAIVRHPFFLNAMVYFPLVLLGVERILQQQKPGVFIAAITFSAVSNFYFFYMIFVLMALYILMRLAVLHKAQGKAGIRHAFIDFGKLVGTGLIGLLIACALFVPTVFAFLADARSGGSSGSIALLYSPEHLKSLVFGFVSVSDPGDYGFMGFGMLGLLAVGSLFLDKNKHAELKLAFVVCTVMVLLPVAGWALNGFSYASNRWIWGYGFTVACILVCQWQRLFELPKRQIGILACLCIAYLALALYCGIDSYGLLSCALIIAFEALVALVALGLAHHYSRYREEHDNSEHNNSIHADATDSSLIPRRDSLTSRRKKLGGNPHLIGRVFIALIACSATANALCAYAPFAGNYIDEEVDAEYFTDFLHNEAAIVQETSKDFSYWRYSGTYWILQPNAGFNAGVPSTDYYWSLSNSVIFDYLEELGVNTQEYERNRYRNLDERSYVEELANVKYHLACEDEPVPYGFTLADGEQSADRSWKIYENTQTPPFAFALSQATPTSLYDSMSMAQRQQAVLQSAVVSDSVIQETGLEQAELDDQSSELDYKLELADNVGLVSQDTFETDTWGSITLTFEGLPNCETYLQIEDMSYSGSSVTKLKIPIYFTDENGNTEKRSLKFATADYERASGQNAFLVNSGYSQSALTQVQIKFPACGTYHMKLSIVCQDFESYDEDVEALCAAGCENLDLHYSNEELALGTHVSFDISTENTAVVRTAIPLSDGWEATVDGKACDIIPVDTMYSGVVVPAGTHAIELRYHTPGLKLGIALSALGLILLLPLNLMQHRKAIRKESRPQHDDTMSAL